MQVDLAAVHADVGNVATGCHHLLAELEGFGDAHGLDGGVHAALRGDPLLVAQAIELSRRGFVVLAMDMTGHGNSDAAVGQQGFGGPAALRYLRGLPYVDTANVGLEGHSLGGGPVVAAAESAPDGYKAVVLEGSTPAIGAVFGAGARVACATWPSCLASMTSSPR